uniref:Reverse transcriptase domain-containing protein n=1 Tax=Ascaris lumbricoides TaxID=6252 RepID=A0A0M3ICT1_ASCLU
LQNQDLTNHSPRVFSGDQIRFRAISLPDGTWRAVKVSHLFADDIRIGGFHTVKLGSICRRSLEDLMALSLQQSTMYIARALAKADANQIANVATSSSQWLRSIATLSLQTLPILFEWELPRYFIEVDIVLSAYAYRLGTLRRAYLPA